MLPQNPKGFDESVKSAAANSRPALRFTIMDKLNIYLASDVPFPAVAELGRWTGKRIT